MPTLVSPTTVAGTARVRGFPQLMPVGVVVDVVVLCVVVVAMSVVAG